MIIPGGVFRPIIDLADAKVTFFEQNYVRRFQVIFLALLIAGLLCHNVFHHFHFEHFQFLTALTAGWT